MVFPLLGNSDHCISVSVDVLSCTYWNGHCDHVRDVPWEIVCASVTAVKFCGWVQVGNNVYIRNGKYQVNLH